jgi:hypothetical protein
MMRTLLQRNLSEGFGFLTAALLILSFSGIQAQADLQITEMFPGQSGDDLTADWFEIKNEGDEAWVAGSSPDLFYDDESADPVDAVPIEGITDIQPGEYVIVLITDDSLDLAAFSLVWSSVIDLTGIKIGRADGSGLGSSGDGVNIWLGDPSATAPADTESYPDTGDNDGLSYDVELGMFSISGNASGAVVTILLGGDNNDVPNVGSPGNQGPVIVDPGTPIIVGDTANASPFLNVLYNVPGTVPVGADLNDPTDPSRTIGIPFLIDDEDTPVEDLIVTATSDNQITVPDGNLTITGSGDSRTLFIEPVAVGFSTISVFVSDLDGNTDNYIIRYAASDATIDPATTRFHHAASDGSTAQAIGGDYMWVADDEDQTIRLFDRRQSGMPINRFNFNTSLGDDEEIDIEGSFRVGDTLYWMGSHTNADRSTIFSTVESGSGSEAELAFIGQYENLLGDLIAWESFNGHSLGMNFLGLANGLEIEGLSADPNNPDGALLAFRGPLIEGKALVVPVINFRSIVDSNAGSGAALFGDPIFLDLQGRSIRSLECNENGCLIIAGPAGTTTEFRLLTWTGDPEDEPELRAADLMPQANTSSFEGIVALPDSAFLGSDGDSVTVQFLVDTGTFDYYGTGDEAKDLPEEAWKKFRSELVRLGEVVIPPIANPGDVVINEIMQNPSAVADSEGEWLELYNASPMPIDLNGWVLSDADSDQHIIDNGGPLNIAPGGYLLLGNNPDPITNGGVPIDYAYGTALNLANGSDELILTAPDSVEVDRVAWDNGMTFPDPDGASMSLQLPAQDNNDGANWCVAMTPYGDGDFGTPGGLNDCAPPPAADLRVTEIWPGQSGDDLTEDWFEITNFGTEAWVSGSSPDLFYDDDSQDPSSAEPINGITDIQPGESVIVVVDQASAVDGFTNIWAPDYDLAGIEVGWADGSGISQGGDGVTLFLDDPTLGNIIDFAMIPAAPSGVSFDFVLNAFSQQGGGTVELGTNIAVATTATAGSSGTEPAIGSPGNQGPLVAPEVEFAITELFPGQDGDDLTEDWIEIKNTGTAPWTAGVDSTLYYDDESQDPADAVAIQGLTELAPGEAAIVLLTDNAADITTFVEVWSPVIDLAGVEIGFADGSGLGGGGDAATLWLGDPMATSPIDTASYPDTEGFDGRSFDVELQAFSQVGNANGAVATIALGGDMADTPNIGSPGDGLAVPPVTGLSITELFPGQDGDDLTEDWIEIKNTGTAPWTAGVDSTLYYDDESQDPADAVAIQGLTELAPGEAAIVLLTDNAADITTFVEVWSPVIDLAGVEIGFADGSGLGGGGDAATLWLGDPMATSPIDTASYPDTEGFDGRSFDVELQAFSQVGNANGAVATIALGGDMADTPNIGSPGDGNPILEARDRSQAYRFELFPNPVSDRVELQVESRESIELVELYDQTGRLLMSQPVANFGTIELDLSGLPNALYFVQLKGSDGTAVKRVIKQ